MSKASGPEQRIVYFSGRVQGVGFRYTAVRVAGGFEVTGFVENLDDGRVLLVAEGEAAELDRFLSALREAMSGYIYGEQSSVQAASGQFRGFGVRR